MSLTIARYTLIEAFRSRTIVLLACALAAALALAFFLRLVAITEVEQVQGVIIAALVRLCAAFLLAVLVVSGLRRTAAAVRRTRARCRVGRLARR